MGAARTLITSDAIFSYPPFPKEENMGMSRDSGILDPAGPGKRRLMNWHESQNTGGSRVKLGEGNPCNSIADHQNQLPPPDFYEDATAPVSDLEEIIDELNKLLKKRKNGTKAQREALLLAIGHIHESVDVLMSIENKL